MAYFSDAQEVYDTVGRLFVEITGEDDDLSPVLRAADTVVRYEYSRPDAVITVRMQEADGELVEFGETGTEPEVTMRMAADTAHRFWLGDVNVTIAMARGEITAAGPVAKVLRLVPLSKAAFPRYRQQLIEQGREDLATLV
jgi:putative sterol carrier protein